ncbi:MAG TPA: MBL fold metallo-hydrolase [Polyangia bacterium]|jgi:L-ascorbate metabolism protein UlaG (beta-lactamase superfamily)|nr:MBL fold metallo-hydrolase [Polyangia bacterium]
MSPAKRHPTGFLFTERARELDHEHRKRLRGALPLTLSMRYLAGAFERFRRGTTPAKATPTPRPPDGTIAITFVGHATVMITTPRSRVLCDPFLENSLFGVRRAKAAGIATTDLADVDVVLVTHAHRDHLSPYSLARLPGAARVIVPPNCEALVRRAGLQKIEELEPGRSFRPSDTSDIEVTAVPVRHSGARGFGDYARRGACGYVVRTPRHVIYIAGDTGYFSGFAEIGRRFRPDVALLPIAGYEPASFREEHMSPLDAVYAFQDLGARVMIPTSYGSFPLSYEPLEAPLEWLNQIMRARGLPLCGAQAQGAEHAPCVAILDHGETVRFSKQGAQTA